MVSPGGNDCNLSAHTPGVYASRGGVVPDRVWPALPRSLPDVRLGRAGAQSGSARHPPAAVSSAVPDGTSSFVE
jgi:hypothetical protein